MNSDPTPAQIQGTAKRNEGNSGLYQLAGDLHHERLVSSYFNWNGTRAGQIFAKDAPREQGICDFIREHVRTHPGGRVAIVGNSWGGHTALAVCRQLLDSPCPLAIDFVVFLDASSAGGRLQVQAAPKGLPINVDRTTNYFTRNLFVWKQWSQDRRIEHIDLGDAKRGFMENGIPAYAAQFDFAAHVAAEWDEKVHTDIKRRLLALVDESQAAE